MVDIDKIPLLVERLQKLNDNFWAILRTTIEETLGEKLPSCTRCSKPMIPRRTYAKLTREQKEAIKGVILKGYTATHCATCQGSVNALDEAELIRLRRQVGA